MPAWDSSLVCHKFQFSNDKHPSIRLRSDTSPLVHLSPSGPLARKRGGIAEGATYFVAQSKCRRPISPKRFLAGPPLGGGGVLPCCRTRFEGKDTAAPWCRHTDW